MSCLSISSCCLDVWWCVLKLHHLLLRLQAIAVETLLLHHDELKVRGCCIGVRAHNIVSGVRCIKLHVLTQSCWGCGAVHQVTCGSVLTIMFQGCSASSGYI